MPLWIIFTKWPGAGWPRRGRSRQSWGEGGKDRLEAREDPRVRRRSSDSSRFRGPRSRRWSRSPAKWSAVWRRSAARLMESR